NPFQVPTSKSGSPSSAIVGTSGTAGLRRVDARPMARTLLPRICGVTAGSVAKLTCASPDITATTAGDPPLYGTCVMLALIPRTSSSPDRWPGEPMPDDAYNV